MLKLGKSKFIKDIFLQYGYTRLFQVKAKLKV